MTPEQQPELGNQPDHGLDVLWVSTVGVDDLCAGLPTVESSVRWSDRVEIEAGRPVHGTVTVEVRSNDDAELLRRLLSRGRPLSITSSVGWSQRVLLTGLSRVDTETQNDGDELVIATYTWISTASLN